MVGLQNPQIQCCAINNRRQWSRLDPRTAFDELNLLSEPQSFREGEALKKAIEFMQLGENEKAYRQLVQALERRRKV